MFEFYKDDTEHWFEVTEKLDGTSCSYYSKSKNRIFGTHFKELLEAFPNKVTNFIKFKLYGHDIGVCSRNMELDYSKEQVMWQLADKLQLEKVLPKLAGQYAFQGEIVGPSIQGNPYDLPERMFFVFNIYDIKERQYLEPGERLRLLVHIDHHFNITIPHVPIVELRMPASELESVQHLLQYAEDKSALNPKKEREGIVFKRNDGKFSFKAISNKYLLNQKD
jgi:RNA ligase (TIGR02306 family)